MSDPKPSASQQETIPEQDHTFWLQWVEAAFPDLDSRAYFLPPVYFNRVPMTRQSSGGQEVLVLHEAPGHAGQSTSAQPGQSTPRQPGLSTPGQTGLSTPGQLDQLTPGQLDQLTPGHPGQSTSGQPGQSIPGQLDQSTPAQPGQPTPGQPSQSTPGQPGQSTPGQPGQSTPAQPGQPTPGQPSQSTPGQPGQSTPGQLDQSTPAQPGQPTPGQPSQSTPGQPGQSTPGQLDQSTAAQPGQPTPGQPSQSTPGQPGQSTPGQLDQSTTAQPGQSTPAQSGQSTPGQPGQSTPGHPGQSTPGQPSQSTPGQPGLSTPEQLCQSTPVQLGQSTPGQPGQSTPGQPGQSTPGQPSQSTPGQPGLSTPEQLGQSTPAQPGQPTPGQLGQPTPGQPGQPTPGQLGQPTPGQPGQSTPVQVGQSTPGQPGQSTPAQPGQPTPGQPGQSTPVQVGQSTPGQPGLSTPEQLDQSTPAQPGQSTPGQPGQSTPAQPGLSTPAQPGQSTPAQPGQSTPAQPGQSTPAQPGQSTPAQPGQPTSGQPGQPTPVQVGQSTPGQPGPVISSDPDLTSMPQPPPVQDSDVRDDAAMQRVLFCLQEMAEKKGEVLVGLTQLQFGQYLGERCYAATDATAATTRSPRPLPDKLHRVQQSRRGDFDVLLIHRQYGLVVCEVKAFGDNVRDLNMPQNDIATNIRKKLKQAVSQLDKAEEVLSPLVSDIASGLRITKTIAVPNLTASQVQEAISGDTKLTQDISRCLRTTDPADIPGLCLCSDQLSDSKTPWDVTSDVLRELGNWWQRRVGVSGPDSHMTHDLYKTLVARICGPATTVAVSCTSPPRLCVKTLGQAVSLTGELYTAHITLFPEQVHLLNTTLSRVFLTGPPGTGKTVVLQLMAIEWLRHGNDVYILSTSVWSDAVGFLLQKVLLHTVSTQMTSVESPGQIQLLKYDFYRQEDVEKALNKLSQAAKGESLCVIADEPYGDDHFQEFCDKLLKQVPGLKLWAGRCYHSYAPEPAGWHVECLTRPLRSPLAVVREVQEDTAITERVVVRAYSDRGVPDHTDGPPVKRLCHRGQGHSGYMPYDCVTCGREVASFLNGLHDSCPAPPGLQWRDMVVLLWYDNCENLSPEVVTQLKEAGIPVRVMKDEDTKDVATAESDVVWVAYARRAVGLERKVVVCLDNDDDLDTTRLLSMSRCKAQLMIVSP